MQRLQPTTMVMRIFTRAVACGVLLLLAQTSLGAQVADPTRAALFREMNSAARDSTRPSRLRWVLATADSFETAVAPTSVLYFLRSVAAARLAAHLVRDSLALRNCAGAKEVRRLLSIVEIHAPRHCVEPCTWLREVVGVRQALDGPTTSALQGCT